MRRGPGSERCSARRLPDERAGLAQDLLVTDLPARSSALRGRPMILSFDVDCGEVLPGHRFIARGLSGPWLLDLPELDEDEEEDEDETGHTLDRGPFEEYRTSEQITEDVAGAGGYPGFALEYELVPGLREDQNLFEALVGVWYEADVPLPWEPGDSGALAPFQGGSSTHGSRGDWPLPPDTRVLTFTLQRPMHAADDSLGQLLVHLTTGEATWIASKNEEAG